MVHRVKKPLCQKYDRHISHWVQEIRLLISNLARRSAAHNSTLSGMQLPPVASRAYALRYTYNHKTEIILQLRQPAPSEAGCVARCDTRMRRLEVSPKVTL